MIDPRRQGQSVGKLYFGDNLDMLREHVSDESIDLVYLDPPFNSKAQYNVLFKSPGGLAADAQLEAFQDSWAWGETSERAFAGVVDHGGGAAKVLVALRASLGESDVMAYLAMMSVRLIELRRVLKPSGSLFLHCDPTASHYLKVILDGIFGPASFRNEVVWKRQTAHSDAKSRFATVSDSILYFAKSSSTRFNVVREPLDPDYVKDFYRHIDQDGRRFSLDNISAPAGGGMAAINKITGKPNGWYQWKGYEPPTRGWRYSKETMARLDAEGRIYYPQKTNQRLRLKRYLDENKGQAVSNVWTDIAPLHGSAREALGYPTQKPMALLERIIEASTQPGDLVLDPFCGCGTSVHAAAKLGRDWIGIDVTHHAVTIIEDRLRRAYPGSRIETEGRPRDLASARDLARRDKYQFQWWANWLFGVDQYRERKKGADRGIDGERFFLNGPRGVGRIIISVKGGDHVGVEAVRDLRAVLDRENAELGVLVTLAAHTRPMMTEAASTGFVQTAHGQFPKMQLVAVGDLFAGRRPVLPVRAPFDQLKAAVPAKARRDDRQLAFTFAIDGGHAKTPEGDVIVLDPAMRAAATG